MACEAAQNCGWMGYTVIRGLVRGVCACKEAVIGVSDEKNEVAMDRRRSIAHPLITKNGFPVSLKSFAA